MKCHCVTLTQNTQSNDYRVTLKRKIPFSNRHCVGLWVDRIEVYAVIKKGNIFNKWNQEPLENESNGFIVVNTWPSIVTDCVQWNIMRRHVHVSSCHQDERSGRERAQCRKIGQCRSKLCDASCFCSQSDATSTHFQ